MYVEVISNANGATLQRLTSKSTGVATVSTIGSYTQQACGQTKSAEVHPGFIQGVRKAGTYSRLVWTTKSFPQEWAWKEEPSRYKEILNGYGRLTDMSSITSLSNSAYSSRFTALISQAQTIARSKMNQGPVDFGVALGESRQLISHLAHQGVRLGNIVSALRRRSSRPLGKGDPQSYWLEIQYAWKPLLSDIYGTYELLQEGLASKGMVLTSHGTARDSVTVTSVSGYQIPVKLSVTCDLTARVSDPTIAGLRSLGLINPALVAWNIMPWSFVIDWFVPVGTFLEAVTATAGLSFLTGSYTRHLEIEHEYIATVFPDTSYTKPCICRHEVRAVNVQRSVLGSFPVPLPFVDRNPLRAGRAINAIALALQVLKKR